MEYAFGDHAHGLTVVFVSLDGVAAATVRDNQRQYHPHLKVAALALEGPHAGALKPLLMQVLGLVLRMYNAMPFFGVKWTFLMHIPFPLCNLYIPASYALYFPRILR